MKRRARRWAFVVAAVLAVAFGLIFVAVFPQVVTPGFPTTIVVVGGIAWFAIAAGLIALGIYSERRR